MRRALKCQGHLNKKYDVFPLREMEGCSPSETSGSPGLLVVWGNSGNGKTSFVMQLYRELCKL